MAKAITSKTYKGVRDWSMKAALKGNDIVVTVKLGRMKMDDPPLVVPLSEWPVKAVNPAYEQSQYLGRRFNLETDPKVTRLLDEATKAINEVVRACEGKESARVIESGLGLGEQELMLQDGDPALDELGDGDPIFEEAQEEGEESPARPTDAQMATLDVAEAFFNGHLDDDQRRAMVEATERSRRVREDLDLPAAEPEPPEPREAGVHWLQMRRIRIDGGTQSRVRLDPTIVQDYAERFMANAAMTVPVGTSSNALWWGNFPALDVYLDNDYWLADGFHRLAGISQALERAGLPLVSARNWQVYCRVYLGSQRDAVLYAAGANANHGLRRTNADKRKAVETLLRDEEWRLWSDAEIARRCKVDPKTVANVRQQVVTTMEIHSEMRKTADGRIMDTSNIGRKPEPDHATVHDLTLCVASWFDFDLMGAGDDVTANKLSVLGFLRKNPEDHPAFLQLQKRLPTNWRKAELRQALNNLYESRRTWELQAKATEVYVEPAAEPKVEPEPQAAAWPPLPERVEIDDEELSAAGYYLLRSEYGPGSREEYLYRYWWTDTVNTACGAQRARPTLAIEDARIHFGLHKPAVVDPEAKAPTATTATAIFIDAGKVRRKLTPKEVDAVNVEVAKIQDAAPDPERYETIPMMQHGSLTEVGFVLHIKGEPGYRGNWRWAWTKDGEDLHGEWLPAPMLAADQGLRWFNAFHKPSAPVADPEPVPTCRICGCTDDHACEGGCWWVEADLCSTCAAAMEAGPVVEMEPEEDGPYGMFDRAWVMHNLTTGKADNADFLTALNGLATADDLREALRTPSQLGDKHANARAGVIGKRLSAIATPTPDPRIGQAQALLSMLITVREMARADYGELTGRHTDLLVWERDTELLLEPLESLIEILSGGAADA